MRRAGSLVILAFFGWALMLARGGEAYPQRLLYVGDSTSPRARDYQTFLNSNFARVEITSRRGFDPAQARDFDVVLLDWPQGSGSFPPGTAPLGKREEWSKPTVLLGSAGLLLSQTWDIKGGHG
jgi:hypothetical protein